MKHILFMTALLGLSLATQALTLDEALGIARTNAPTLRAASAGEQAARLSAAAAGLWDNPELEVEGEGLGGDNDGFNDGEYAVSITQAIPLGGRSKNERAVAQQALQMTFQMTTEAELVLEKNVRAAFAEALAQQEIAKVRTEQEELAREFVAVAKQRNEAGGASDLEVVQANLALEEVLMEQQCCFGDLDGARKIVASLLGITLKEVGTPTGDLSELKAVVPLTVDEAHPVLQRLLAEEAMVRAEAALAKSQGAGDLSLGAGVKYEAADDAQSFVISASIPLSIRKRGSLERAAALLRADAVRAQREAVRRDLQQELDRVVLTYRRAGAEANQYKIRMLPIAEQAYALSRKGYDAGRYSWMELLAAQQNLAEIRIRTIEALLDAQKASAELTQFKTGEE